MHVRTAWLLLLIALVGCGWPDPRYFDLVFLTREGCVQTDSMRARLDEALTALRLPTVYGVVDVGALPDSDPRGYGTPTVLVFGHDLFGMLEPSIPHEPPT